MARAATHPRGTPSPRTPPVRTARCRAPRRRAGGSATLPLELRLRELVAEVGPRWLAVVGITAYRIAFASPRAVVGPQQLRLGATRVWALPNPSGLNAHWPLPAMVSEFARLRVAAAAAAEDA
ncbi:MAG: hypothetical protein GEU83_01125 [Pseudonocardiaceae bacterium]|nr:hypothetical protein [Pseudonocardiaceae bacterium]